ncbi:MAG: adenylyltransferase/cytidyltransferase family protein [Saprospiraceae bacterium]|nr:adenylyltransferase/cytidyltransferase family protein [Saprospiraceae bacterium]
MLNTIQNKIVNLSEASLRVDRWRQEGGLIVWTNGVFDLIHPGHIRYLCAAKALGQYLVVGINSDASGKRLKGPDRPINTEEHRLLQMAAMQMADLVVLFEEDTPLECILKVRPDIIAKGGDYQEEEVVGGKEAKAWGGAVKLLPFETGHSSSKIIESIKRANQ